MKKSKKLVLVSGLLALSLVMFGCDQNVPETDSGNKTEQTTDKTDTTEKTEDKKDESSTTEKTDDKKDDTSTTGNTDDTGSSDSTGSGDNGGNTGSGDNGGSENNGGSEDNNPALKATYTIDTTIPLEIEKNPYGEDYQKKVMSLLTDELAVGDKIKVVLKGAANNSIAKLKAGVVDTSKAASYWLERSEMVEFTAITANEDFDLSVEIEITKAAVGTVNDQALVLAYDGTEATKIFKDASSIVEDDPSELWVGNVTVDWSSEANRIVLGKDKFANATDDSKIELEISKASGQFKLPNLKDDWKTSFVAGTAEGAGLTEKKDAWWVNDTGKVSYKPSADEWTIIKEVGLVIFGDGLTITSVHLK